MKILILGGTGMLGHMITKYLQLHNKYQITVCVRDLGSIKNIFEKTISFISDMDCNDMKKMKEIVTRENPDICINCIGIIKQNDLAKNYVESIYINSLFPHLMRIVCNDINCRFIHFSTDCVFDGLSGNYCEKDTPNATDLYGLSKLLGERYDDNSLTLRTSIIGPELSRKSSLLEWFLSQKTVVKGYTKAYFSGLTTLEIAKQLHQNILPNVAMKGLYHLSGPKINKYQLLLEVAKIYKKNIQMIPDDTLVIDRSLRANRYKEKTGYVPPSWTIMLEELKHFT